MGYLDSYAFDSFCWCQFDGDSRALRPTLRFGNQLTAACWDALQVKPALRIGSRVGRFEPHRHQFFQRSAVAGLDGCVSDRRTISPVHSAGRATRGLNHEFELLGQRHIKLDGLRRRMLFILHPGDVGASGQVLNHKPALVGLDCLGAFGDFR